MEGETGQILWSSNPHLALPPASTTKIMTVLLALERAPLTRLVTVSKGASKTDGSSIWLEAGEKRTMRELVYGAMLNSGNDACVAMAEAIAGSEAAFASLMTERARELGAKETKFVNADGLPAPGHLTSAHDLALIARAALSNRTFAEIVQKKVENIPWPGKDWDRRLINHNKLLWRYDGADGVKTGYTRESGHCLVASATREGRRLIAVVLDSRDMYKDTGALLDYGFSHYALVKPAAAASRSITVVGGRRGSLSLRPSRALAYAVPAGQAGLVRLVMEAPRRVRAPIAEGQKLGWAALYRGRELLGRVSLVAANAVEPRNFLWSVASFILRVFA